MKRKLVISLAILTCFVLVSGCSFKIPNFSILQKKSETVVQKTYAEEKAPDKTPEEYVKELQVQIDMMVENLKGGNWNQAITVGEAAMEAIETMPKKKVNQSVYDAYGVKSIKEKLYEVLTDAYDYKVNVDGLTTDEKEKYLRTAKAHWDIDINDNFKKHEYARVLIETGKLEEGLKLATEVYNIPEIRNREVTDTYAWALYLSGKKLESYNIYRYFYGQANTLVQLLHSARVVEEYNKGIGLLLYKSCVSAGNNLMVIEPNVNNYSAQSYINKITHESQKASDRLLAGGTGIDSQYNLDLMKSVIKSVVAL